MWAVRSHVDACDCSDDPLFVNFLLFEDAGHTAKPQYNDPVSDGQHVAEIVGYDHDTAPFQSHPTDHIKNLSGLFDAQRGRRFVEEDKSRVAQDGRAQLRLPAVGPPRDGRPRSKVKGS